MGVTSSHLPPLVIVVVPRKFRMEGTCLFTYEPQKCGNARRKFQRLSECTIRTPLSPNQSVGGRKRVSVKPLRKHKVSVSNAGGREYVLLCSAGRGCPYGPTSPHACPPLSMIHYRGSPESRVCASLPNTPKRYGCASRDVLQPSRSGSGGKQWNLMCTTLP